MKRSHPLVALLRPVLAPTAAADVLAGAAFAGDPRWERVAPAVVAALCLYTGGMVHNDIVDRRRDRELHPERPLVADPGLVGRARLLAAGLTAGGLGAAALAGLFWPAAAVALLATAYNAGLKRTFPADVLCLGGARTANLALGFAAGGYGGTGGMAAYGAGYLVVIACVTAASRAEDLAEPPTRRLALLLSFLPLALVYGAGLVFAEGWRRGLPFVAPAALQAAALRAAMIAGTREAARRYVFRSLLLLFAFHACVLWAADRPDGLIGVSACAAATFLLLARR